MEATLQELPEPKKSQKLPQWQWKQQELVALAAKS
jgi:hypothetical protein